MTMNFGPAGGGGTALEPTQAIVSDGTTQTLLPATGTTPAQGSMTINVAANVPSFRLAANRIALTTGATGVLQNSAGVAAGGNATINIAANAITNIRTPATIAPVATGNQTITDQAGKASTATRTVATGAITTTVLAGTDCVVKNGDTFPVTGGNVSAVVAAGVPTFTFTPTP